MASVTVQTVFIFLLDSTDMTYRWFKDEQRVVSMDSFMLGTTIPRRRLADTKLALASHVVLDENGYFIKKPTPVVIGSNTRVYSNALEWLNSVSLHDFRDLGSRIQYGPDVTGFVISNPPFESELFKQFLPFTLPVGLPTAL